MKIDAGDRRREHVALGVGAAVLGTLLLVSQDAVSKHLVDRLSAPEIIFWRGLFSLPLVLTLAAARGEIARLVPRRPSLVGLRSLISFFTSAMIVLAVALVPFADAMAILQIAPLLILLMAGPILGERPHPVGWIAVAVGLVGAILVLSPGGNPLTLAVIVPFLAALSAAVQDIVTRAAARRDTPVAILFWTVFAAVAGAALWAATDGGPRLPGADLLPWLALAGLLSASAFYATIAALDLASPARLAPVRYTALVWGVLFGLIGWGEVPSLSALAGMALITAAGLAALKARPARGP